MPVATTANAEKPPVLAVVANHDFSREADDLKARLGRYYDTLLIDSGSPQPPETADIRLPNRFYTGLWNEAVRLAVRENSTWLMFVTSDVQIGDVAGLARCAEDCLWNESIGIYTPSLSGNSTASFGDCFCQESGAPRECHLVEGFFFLARTELLTAFHPVDRKLNKYGWGIDIYTCYRAHLAGYKVVVDDRVTIYHPAATHRIDREEALEQCREFLKDEGVLRFLKYLGYGVAAKPAELPRDRLEAAFQAHSSGRIDEAIRLYQAAIRGGERGPGVYNDLGVALRRKGLRSAAMVCYRRALASDPDYARAWSNLGNAYLDAGNYSASIACHRRAVEADPSDPDFGYNLGLALREAGFAGQALQHFDRALERRPGCLDFDFTRGCTLLQLGRYSEGLPAYERRFELTCARQREFSTPLWDGGSLKGKRLFLFAEQGYGDMIQFARFVPLLVERFDAEVSLECYPHLVRLFESLHPRVRIVPAGPRLPQHDVHAPLMSLPYLLGTTEKNLPARTPYLGVRDKRGLGSLVDPSKNLKVGLTWSGKKWPCDRSCPFEHLAGILGTPGVDFYSLQRGEAANDIARFGCEIFVRELGSQLEDFAADAEVIEHLDLVITIDTAMCHLAAALNKPTWTLLPHPADWRFGLNRADSPWYPTMKLFRQSKPKDWAPVIDEVKSALSQLASRRADRPIAG